MYLFHMHISIPLIKPKTPTKAMSSNPSKPPQTTTQTTFTGVGNFIKLLPTGTMFTYQFLNPILTNNGQCNVIHKYLTSILIAVCAACCFFASFTDSYTDSEGSVHYGLATTKGLWLWTTPASSFEEEVDLSSYKLRFGDFVHALFSLMVFLVVSLLDYSTVGCFYPSFESTQKVLLMAVPPAIGALAGTVFVMFPWKRHGIGYPRTQTSLTQA